LRRNAVIGDEFAGMRYGHGVTVIPSVVKGANSSMISRACAPAYVC